MLTGVITTRSVLSHPIVLFRNFKLRMAMRMLIWALDGHDHKFLSDELFSGRQKKKINGNKFKKWKKVLIVVTTIVLIPFLLFLLKNRVMGDPPNTKGVGEIAWEAETADLIETTYTREDIGPRKKILRK